MILDQEWMDKADALLAECDAYYLGETDIITKNFTITGQVRAMPQDSIDLYHEFIDYDSMTPQDQAAFLNL